MIKIYFIYNIILFLIIDTKKLNLLPANKTKVKCIDKQLYVLNYLSYNSSDLFLYILILVFSFQ